MEGNSSQSYTAEISGNSIINENDEANMEEDVCAICLEQFSKLCCENDCNAFRMI